MQHGLNKVQIIGWVDGTPEARFTSSGRPVVSFTVMTPTSWVSADGTPHDEQEWVNIVAWGGTAEYCRRQLADGRQVYLEGRLQTRSWEDSDGSLHYRTEVVAQSVMLLGHAAP